MKDFMQEILISQAFSTIFLMLKNKDLVKKFISAIRKLNTITGLIIQQYDNPPRDSPDSTITSNT